MKNIIVIVASLLISNLLIGQQLHVVTATDHEFTPDSLYVTVGDTVSINSIGYHSMTELDSIDWENNVATSNGGFWVGFGSPTSSSEFIVTAPGTYYYNCNPHAGMGMKAMLFATQGTGIESVTGETKFSIYYGSGGNLVVQYNNADELVLYNVAGQQVLTELLSNTENYNSISVDLKQGIYIAVFKQNGEILSSSKFVVNNQ